MSKKKNKSNFVIQGSILAIAGILVRIIGLAYRIPLLRVIGDEGIGYYSTAFNVYSIMLLLSSYSLPLAVSKMVSARLAKGEYKNVRRVLISALFYATLAGFGGSIFMIYFAEYLANEVFHMPLSKYAILTLAPTIWIMGYLGVLRGYFQGKSTMIPTAISQILEQVVNAFVSVGAAWYMCEFALRTHRDEHTVRAFGASGGTIGTGAGAFTALLVLVLLFVMESKSRRQKLREDESSGQESYFGISKILLFTVLPVIFSATIYNINSILDNSIFGKAMSSRGMEAFEISKSYGIYTSRYLLLIHVPVAISNALSSSLIPALAGASRTKGSIRAKVRSAVRFSMLISIPCAVGLAVLADPIMTMLLGENEMASQMLRIGSIAVVLYSLSTVSNAVLQGTNHMMIPVFNAIIALILHIAALVLMLNVFHMGAYGLVHANTVFAFLVCIFNAGAIRRVLGYRQEFVQTFLGPSICAALMGVATAFSYRLLRGFGMGLRLATILAVMIAVFVYALTVLLTGCVGERELSAMPGGKRLLRIFRAFGMNLA